jgi:uncharacterized RDD family membrane protein YckC
MRQVIDVSQVEYASYPQRVFARLLDLLILTGMLLAFIEFAGDGIPSDPADIQADLGLGPLVWFLPLLYMAYEVPTTAARGVTLGKRIMGICVVRTDGEIGIGLDRALIRFCVPMVIGWIPIIGIFLSFGSQAWFFFDPNRQNVPDKAARTFVIRAPKRNHDRTEDEYYVPPGEE